MYSVQNLYEQYGKKLGLNLLSGKKGMNRRIYRAEVHRPGLSLAGFLKGFVSTRILVIGKQEIGYLKELDVKVREERLETILTSKTPAVVAAKGVRPSKEMISLCNKKQIPLFLSEETATDLLSRLSFFLV